jgi:hypothetical protein
MLRSPVVNLSCGNCKSIRSFSGDRLQCDVCGWVCQDVGADPQQHQRAAFISDIRREVSGRLTAWSFAVTAVIALGVLWILIAIIKFIWVHS